MSRRNHPRNGRRDRRKQANRLSEESKLNRSAVITRAELDEDDRWLMLRAEPLVEDLAAVTDEEERTRLRRRVKRTTHRMSGQAWREFQGWAFNSHGVRL